jgi:rhomboid protease GluP
MAVTQVFFGINVAVFLAMLFAGVSMLDNPAGQDLVHWGANFGPYTVGGQWWRLLTCVFIHGGLLHIAFNMWCLWDLGRLAESLYGHWTFAALYLITGLSASLASVIWNPVTLSVGASGAIFGIAGALIASFYLGEFSVPRAQITGTLRSVAVFVGYNLIFGAAIARVDNAAHVGGLLMGLLLGALMARVAPNPEQPLRRIGVLLFGLLLIAGGIKWLQHSRGYLSSTDQARESLTDGKTKDAIAQLETVVRERPDYLPAHLELARAYIIQRDYEKAAAELRRTVALNPTSRNAYYSLGYTELELNHPEQARDAFQQLIKLDPNSAEGHSGLGAVFSSQNKPAEALQEYKRAAQLNPSYQDVYYNIGVMQGKLGMYDDAITSLLKQRDNGDDPDNEQALAEAYRRKGMSREAADASERAERFLAEH